LYRIAAGLPAAGIVPSGMSLKVEVPRACIPRVNDDRQRLPDGAGGLN